MAVADDVAAREHDVYIYRSDVSKRQKISDTIQMMMVHAITERSIHKYMSAMPQASGTHIGNGGGAKGTVIG